MLARFVALATLFALPLLAVAGGSYGGDHCNTGDMQCCNSVHDANSSEAASVLSLLGLKDITGQVGIHCSPISVIGVGGGSTCSAQPVCCKDNSHGGLVSIGCVPITV